MDLAVDPHVVILTSTFNLPTMNQSLPLPATTQVPVEVRRHGMGRALLELLSASYPDQAVLPHEPRDDCLRCVGRCFRVLLHVGRVCKRRCRTSRATTA